jgi:hypothetical protein
MFINKTEKYLKGNLRIECGKRFVTDIELVAFGRVFGVDVSDLLKE